MKKIKILVCTVLLNIVIINPVAASEISVVTTIKPVHGLVSAVLDGIAVPELLVKGFDSVHGYQLKPSDAQLIERSDMIVWIGEDLETTLIAPVTNLTDDVVVIELSTVEGIKLLPNREGPGGHDDHHDDEHGHEDEHGDEHGDEEHGHEDEHAHNEEHDQDMEHGHEDEHGDEHGDEEHGHEDEHAHNEEHDQDMEHGHEDEHAHAHGAWDMHIWLDISNAKTMVVEISEQIKKLAPEKSEQLASNTNATLERLDALHAELTAKANDIQGANYVVFHDAYQYLEVTYNLSNVGAVTVSPEKEPSAKRVGELQRTIHEKDAQCVFSEPQFNPDILTVITEGTDLRFGVLDPLGAEPEEGPDAYFEILRNLIDSLHQCLS